MPNNLKATIEALLFIYGEPIKIKKLAQIAETDEETVRKTLQYFMDIESFHSGSPTCPYDFGIGN